MISKQEILGRNGRTGGNNFESSSGKKLSLEQSKLWKPEFKRDIWEFDWLEHGNIFDWQLKHISGTFCFYITT